MESGKVHRFDVDGQEVLCHESGNGRLWVCECEHFQRTLKQHGQGFCPHTAVAMMRAMREGTIDFSDLTK